MQDVDIKLAQMALKRRSEFPSKQAAHEYYTRRLPFAALHPDTLAAYIEHGLTDTQGNTPIPSVVLHESCM